MREDEVRYSLRALAEALPQSAGPSVEQRLLVRFRERRGNRKRKTYLAVIAASVMIGLGLYLASWSNRSPIQSVSVKEGDQPSGFITLPYAQSGVPLEQPVIVRVNLPVSELSVIGVPFTQSSAKERVPVDLLVGEDGVARAVRLVE